jgi:uncharacterized protein (PEP-CTERM system associated)
MVTVTGKAVNKKAMKSLQGHYVLGSLYLALVSGVPDICLARADITPRISLSEIYTDNVNLVDSKQKSDYITELTPGFNATLTGERVKASLDYQLQSFFYSSSTDNSSSNHQLEANGTAELYRDAFFLDANTSIFQSIIDPQGTVVLDNINITSNRTDIFVANVSPYWKQRFAESVDAVARYRYGIVNYDENDQGGGTGGGLTQDSRIQQVNLSAGNLLEANRRWAWQTAAGYTSIEYDDNIENKFRYTVGSLGYRITGKLQLILDGGVDDNDFEEENTVDTSGPFWNTGLRWDPSAKNRFEAGFGRRYDGGIYNFLWAFQGRRSALNASYSQTLETNANVLSQEQISDIQDIGAQMPTTGNLFRSDANVFERKLFSVNATIDGVKSSLSLTFADERREIQDATGDENQIISLSGIWNWRYSARTSVILNFFAVQQEFEGSGGGNDIYRASAGLTRQLGPRSTGAIRFVRTRKDADGDVNDYEENRINLSLKITF